MALAPPGGYSVYDIVAGITTALPTIIRPYSIGLATAANTIIHGASEWILSPILKAIGDGVNTIWNALLGILNGAYQAILNAIYAVIVNPLKMLLQNILNRIYEKLEGVIFIAVTVPMMIIEGKQLMHEPTLKGALLFFLKPLLGAIIAKTVSSIFKPMTAPPTITPSTAPTINLIPEPKEVDITPTQAILLDDFLTLEIEPATIYRDEVDIQDLLTIETPPPMDFRDYIYSEDTLTLTIFPPLSMTEALTIEDTINIEIIPPIPLTDQVTVEDTLIIGLG